MKNFLTELLKNIVQRYWIEVTTAKPSCVYYFGPFLTYKGAKLAQSGFIEDLESENAEDIKAEIKRCQPQELTIFEQSNDNSDVAFG
jgi:predicted Zn-dependent peptidase